MSASNKSRVSSDEEMDDGEENDVVYMDDDVINQMAEAADDQDY